MPAPNLETLFDFETNIESAAKTFLETATGLSASSLYASLDQDDFILPRIGISYEDGGAVDPFDTRGSGVEYLKYEGTFNITVITDASLDNTASNHRLIRGKVRSAMLLQADNWTTILDANVSGFTITNPTDSGTAGVYAESGTFGGKKQFVLGDSKVRYDTDRWKIYNANTDDDRWQASLGSEDYPWNASGWTAVQGTGSAPLFSLLTGTSVLPYYDINYMRPMGTTYEVDGNLAISTISYQINVGIRDDAWVS